MSKDKFKIGDANNNIQEDMHIGFVLDASGSMMAVQSSTISGFNEYVETLKNNNANAFFTLLTFNSSEKRVICKDIPMKDVLALNTETYSPQDGTPLYDSIASLITLMSTKVKDGDKVLIVIMTDGLENMSTDYDDKRIKVMISAKESQGWTFTYLGANQDAWAVANTMGIAKSNSLTYSVHEMGKTFNRAAEASVMYVASAGTVTKGLYHDQSVDSEPDLNGII